MQAGIREGQWGNAAWTGPTILHAVAREAGRADECSGPHDPDQRTRDPAVDLFAYDDDGQHAGAIASDQPLNWLSWSTNGPHPADGRRAASRQAEDSRQLLDEYLDPDAGQQPGHDGDRERSRRPSPA